MENIKWWKPNDILGYNCIFNFVVSPRGLGKSYNMVEFFINRFKKHDEQWAYFRRYQEDIDFVRFNLFANLERDGKIKFGECRLYGNRIIYNPKGLDEATLEAEYVKQALKIPDKASKSTRDRIERKNAELREELMNSKIDKSYDKTMGITFPINAATRIKSAGLSNLKWGVFEEFLEEFNQYIPNEVERLLSIYESIDRSRDEFRLFFLGNETSLTNPYYDYFKIYPEADTKFVHLKKYNLVLQRASSESVKDFKHKTRFGKAIENIEYGKFITGQATMDDLSLIKKIDLKDCNYICNLYTTKGLCGLYQFVDMFYIARPRRNQETYNLTPIYKDLMPHIKSIGAFADTIKDKVIRGQIYFSTLTYFAGFKDWYVPS